MPNLKPVLMLTDNQMLASSTQGDQYYLVDENGRSEKIPLERACKIYLDNKDRPGSEPPDSPPETDPSMPEWRRKLNETLGIANRAINARRVDPPQDLEDDLPEYD